MSSKRAKAAVAGKWLEVEGLGTALIDPGKPWQNGAEPREHPRRVTLTHTREKHARAAAFQAHPMSRNFSER